ncbi:acyltransferase family protein [Planosporangium sp. 12N6]|uniref:acyltransferase family protein n=1 Tax=Planosporangium spinosum TaxID=3402278 RepID=UPI003CF43B1E
MDTPVRAVSTLPGPSAVVVSAAPAAGRPPREGRLAVIDGLRLVAALVVVVYHYTFRAPQVWGQPAPTLFPRATLLTQYGWLGVHLFFLISGFVICMSAWGRDLGGFFVSRVVRLFPAYWFGVLATAAVLLAVPAPGQPRPLVTQVLVNLTMLQIPTHVPHIDGSYWSLWEELHFYLLFALLVWRGLSYRRVVLFCVLWTVASVLASGSSDVVVHLVVGDELSSFFIAGVAFYLMYRFGPNLLLWGIVGVSLALGLQRIHPAAMTMEGLGVHKHTWPGVVVVITVIYAVMAAVALGWLNWIRGRWLVVAGALTYPLYLLHQVIGYAVILHLHDRVPRWLLVAGLTAAMLVAAWLVHRVVERPLAPRLKRALVSGLSGAAVDQRPRGHR